MTAANSHYSQPLLPSIAGTFGVAPATMDMLPALTQLGLAVGLFTVLPLADVMERRKLVVVMFVFLAIGAAALAMAPTPLLLLAAAFMVGLGCVAAQMLTPYAALIAPPGRQGEAVGLVLSGILSGALLAKIIAGLAAQIWSWRVPYALSAVLMLITAIGMARALPESPPDHASNYWKLIKSSYNLVRSEPQLRRHALNGGLTYGAMMAFWSTYALHLNHAFGFGPAIAGLFGFVGLAGTLGASVAGRQVDGGRFGQVNLIAALLMAVGFAAMAAFRFSLPVMILGVLLLDAGAGLSHAGNQSSAFALRPAASGRINSIYMTAYFLGGAICTSLAAFAYAWAGWGAVCCLGAGLAATIALLQLHDFRKGLDGIGIRGRRLPDGTS